MIPTHVSEETRQSYIDTILATWHAATPEQVQHGRAWYRVAHELASAMTPDNPRAGAGVIAALSANKSWPENCRLAGLACRSGLTDGHLPDALRKAAAIMSGADPVDVLPMNRKTGQFFRCIANPNDGDAVAIDRHAHDVAVGETYGNRDRGLSSFRRYDLLARCYCEAAARLGELPSTVQAVTWVVHTDRIAGTSTRRPGRRADFQNLGPAGREIPERVRTAA